jgi:hypothetical protein
MFHIVSVYGIKTRKDRPMESQEFYISLGKTHVIQAGSVAGNAVTLETINPDEPLQKWALQAGEADGVSGVLLVNPHTKCAAAYLAMNSAVVMKDYTPSMDESLLWSISAGDLGSVKIIARMQYNAAWVDVSEHPQSGDLIITASPESTNTSNWGIALPQADQ